MSNADAAGQTSRALSIYPVVLAAGASQRMGRPKALLEFAGRTALELISQSCKAAACATPHLVVGYDKTPVTEEASRLGLIVVENPDPARGQLSSLQTGIAALPDEADGFLVIPVDVPLVESETYTALCSAFMQETTHTIVLPCYHGRRGHPGLFSASLKNEFMTLSSEQTARDVLRRDPARVSELDVTDPHVLDRINSPEEYATVAAGLTRER